jgi:hypothetical protein
MKARTFILTTSVAFALVVPVAQAASSNNRLYQTRVQTILFDKTHQTIGKTHVAKTKAVESHAKSKAVNSKKLVHRSFVPAPVAVATTLPAVATNSSGCEDGPDPYLCLESSSGILFPDASAPIEKPLNNAAPATASSMNAPAPVEAPGTDGFNYWDDLP